MKALWHRRATHPHLLGQQPGWPQLPAAQHGVLTPSPFHRHLEAQVCLEGPHLMWRMRRAEYFQKLVCTNPVFRCPFTLRRSEMTHTLRGKGWGCTGDLRLNKTYSTNALSMKQSLLKQVFTGLQ